MIIQAFPSGPFDTNAYAASCPSTGVCAIVDPAPGSAGPICNWLKGHNLKADKILLTHTHWDHIGDVAPLKKMYSCPVLVHKLDAPNLRNPGSDLLPCWIPIEGVEPDGYLAEGENIQIGGLAFEVIHTPGHTPGGVCLYCPKEGVLFSGDTLFKGTIGNLSFPTANAEHMWHSLEKLAMLPADTLVYPGHGPGTTIGDEGWLPKAREIFGN